MTRNRRIRRDVASCLFAGAFAVACGGAAESRSGPGGSATGNAANVIAVYKLDRVNSKPLPIGDGSHIFINGVLELHEDDSWCIELDWRGELGFLRVFGDRGTFALNGRSIAFSSPAGEIATFTGTVDASGSVTVAYQFANAADRFTFVQPPDDLTPRCGQ